MKTDRNEEVTIVAVTRFKNVAILIALARMVVENTSDGINHAPGPIPRLKNPRYIPIAIIPMVALPSTITKEIATRNRDIAIPTYRR